MKSNFELQRLFCFTVLVSLAFGGFRTADAQASDNTPIRPPDEVASSTSAASNEIVPPSRYVKREAPVNIPRFEAPPLIDGVLDDAVWRNSAVFGDFFQTQPGDNVKPTHPTEFMMAYDSKNLYVAFKVIQDRDKVRATMSRRDNIFHDDYVLMYIDTFNDQRQAYVIFFNPLGIQADGTYTEGRGEDYSVDLVMESKGVLTPDGFTIEAAIPFKSLRYEAGKDKKWGLNIFRRVKYNNNEYNAWMPHDRSRSGYLNQAGKITGLEGIETTRQLEVNPSFTVSETGRKTRYTFNNDPAGRYVNEGIKGDFGMTVKFGLTPTITLDFAYNPDFAQVEADAPVTTANQRFPIFFAEKRPFFLERIDIFQSGMNVVNTRAIVDPDIAAKITGRRGKNTFGIMYASDNAPGNYSPDDREGLKHCIANASGPCSVSRFLDQNADIGVLRIKRDVGREHNLGMFATTYNFVDRHNHTAGLDGRFRLNKKTIAEFQVLGTNTRGRFYDPFTDTNSYRTANGFGYRAFLERTDRNLYMNFNAQGRTNLYRTDVGFANRYDTNYIGSFVQYQTDRDAKRSIIYKRIQNNANITYDWKGRSQGLFSNTQGMIALQRQIYIGAGTSQGYERVFEHEFGPARSATNPGAFFGPSSERSTVRNEIYGFLEASPIKQLFFLSVVSHFWGTMDYDLGNGPKYPRVSAPFVARQNACALLEEPICPLPVPGYDPGPGNMLYLENSIRYQPTTAFQIQASYNRRRLKRNDTGLVAFDENILSIRSTYQFTRNIFARTRIDYSNIQSRIRPQFILGWAPSPGKAIYVGYNDDLNYNFYNRYTGNFEPGLRGNGRSFYIKMSYLFKKSI